MARSKKKAITEFDVSKRKGVVQAEQTGGYFKHIPTFSFSRYDKTAPWLKNQDNRPTIDSVLEVLYGYSGQTWAQIYSATGGRRHGTNSHHIDVMNLSKEAQEQANEISLNEGRLFSLRLGGTIRLFGIIEPNGCFFVIWFDPNHEVCPDIR